LLWLAFCVKENATTFGKLISSYTALTGLCLERSLGYTRCFTRVDPFEMPNFGSKNFKKFKNKDVPFSIFKDFLWKKDQIVKGSTWVKHPVLAHFKRFSLKGIYYSKKLSKMWVLNSKRRHIHLQLEVIKSWHVYF